MQDAAAVAYDRLAGEIEATSDRLDTKIEEMPPQGGVSPTVEIAEHAWKQWLAATDFLLSINAPVRALCDAANTVFEARMPSEDRTTA